MAKPKTGDRMGNTKWFLQINFTPTPALHRTKTTASGADVPQYHKGGSSLIPAFPLIRALGFFTHGMKIKLFEGLLEMFIIRPRDNFPLEP